MEVKSAVGKHITCPAMILTWEEAMWNGTTPAALASQKPFHTGQQCLSSIDRYGNIHFSISFAFYTLAVFVVTASYKTVNTMCIP
jgi:hypothetical protein